MLGLKFQIRDSQSVRQISDFYRCFYPILSDLTNHYLIYSSEAGIAQPPAGDFDRYLAALDDFTVEQLGSFTCFKPGDFLQEYGKCWVDDWAELYFLKQQQSLAHYIEKIESAEEKDKATNAEFLQELHRYIFYPLNVSDKKITGYLRNKLIEIAKEDKGLY